MNTWLSNQWDHLRSSFWFLPATMSVVAIALSFTMIRLDEKFAATVIEHVPWLWARGPDGALSLLSTIAGSMITIAGVVFSITIVALTLASAQFGPRLLRNFMRDRGNQISLGTFISTFLYCLLVIRAVKGGEPEQVFVPSLSIAVALVLAIASLGVLIYFMHHVSLMIQAPQVVAVVADDLHDAIERLFPNKIGEEKNTTNDQHGEKDVPEDFEKMASPVRATRGGYLQAIDTDGLMNLAEEKDLLIRVERRPGHFVVIQAPLVMVWPGSRVDDEIVEQIMKAFILGVQRTQEQDVEYAIDQLVEVAVRALSPGINDPFTAINCIDRLGEALCYAAGCAFPSPYRYSEQHVLRIIASHVTFRGMTEAAFNQIRQYGRSSVAVLIRLLESIEVILSCVHLEKDRHALRDQANMIKRGSEEALSEEMDRLEVKKRYQAVMIAFRKKTCDS
ncbi:MAG: hypothetical protein NPIRA04_06350 [Nitrospirales bacterium]|nr:MAG: hypothetical protein NPIRA04_06350 [Nitrospirales bacterium]